MGAIHGDCWKHDDAQLLNRARNLNLDFYDSCDDYYIVYHASVLFHF
jgi:hypothetical protein